jgi:hypothetical protein
MTTVDSPALARDHHTRTNPLWQVQAEVMKIHTTPPAPQPGTARTIAYPPG